VYPRSSSWEKYYVVDGVDVLNKFPRCATSPSSMVWTYPDLKSQSNVRWATIGSEALTTRAPMGFTECMACKAPLGPRMFSCQPGKKLAAP